jgi:hypothetical protein
MFDRGTQFVYGMERTSIGAAELELYIVYGDKTWKWRQGFGFLVCSIGIKAARGDIIRGQGYMLLGLSSTIQEITVQV